MQFCAPVDLAQSVWTNLFGETYGKKYRAVRPPEPLEASLNEVSTKLDMAVAVGRGSMVNYGAVTLRIHPGKVSRQKCLG